MTVTGPPEQQPSAPEEELPPPTSAVERANRMSAANMLRSLAPLVVICLAIVGWLAFLRDDAGTDPVREVDPSSTVRTAAEYAAFPLEAPADLPEGYRATDTDFEGDGPGERVTLGIDYSTPSEDYALFVTSDDPEAEAVGDVLDGAEPDGTVDIGGREWTRSTTERGETALSRQAGEATVLVTGDASDEELETLAASVGPVA
ncbi:DUF4245 domain-containing protein [Blastococcus sp. SYSU D00813]